MKTYCIAALAALAGAAFADAAASPLADARDLVKRFSESSAATVYVRFNAPEDDSSPGFSIPYKCPNCSRTHRHDVSDYVKHDKPLVLPGYITAPDVVMVQDFMFRTGIVASVEVEFAGNRYAAKPYARYPGKGALALKAEHAIAGAKPVKFDGESPLAVDKARFFFQVTENGQRVGGLMPGSSFRFRHFADIGRDVADMPANALVVDSKGRPVSLSFESPKLLDEAAFMPPGKWLPEAPETLDARFAELERKVRSSLVPVYIHRDEEKREGGRSSFRIISSRYDDDRKTDLDTIGFAMEGGELLVPLSLDASKTAEIDKLEAVLPDGSRLPLEYVGAFDEYSLAMVRFPDGKAPSGVAPLRFFAGRPATLFLSTMFSFSARSMDGKLYADMTPERLLDFSEGRGGDVYPNVRLVGSNGRIAFAVTEKGEVAVFAVKRRMEKWSSDSEVSGASVAKLVKDRKFNPEYAIRKGKDRIRVAWIGVETQPLTPDLAREKKVTGFLEAFRTSGALVGRVHSGTPADKAGIREGDVLLYARRKGASERQELAAEGGLGGDIDLGDLLERLGGDRLGIFDADRFAPWPDVEKGVNETFTRFGIGAQVEVGYASDGVKKEVLLSLAPAPTHFRSAKRFKSKAMGAAFADLTFEVRGYYKFADDAPGVVVSKVQPGNPAAVAGLRPLEIVTHVDDKPVNDVKALSDAVRGKREFSLSVRRLAATRIVRVKIQDVDKGDKGD